MLFRLPVSKGVGVIPLSALVTTLVQEWDVLWGCSLSCAQPCLPRPGEHSLDPSVAQEIRIWKCAGRSVELLFGRKLFDQSGAENGSVVQRLLQLWKNGISS